MICADLVSASYSVQVTGCWMQLAKGQTTKNKNNISFHSDNRISIDQWTLSENVFCIQLTVVSARPSFHNMQDSIKSYSPQNICFSSLHSAHNSHVWLILHNTYSLKIQVGYWSSCHFLPGAWDTPLTPQSFFFRLKWGLLVSYAASLTPSMHM